MSFDGWLQESLWSFWSLSLSVPSTQEVIVSNSMRLFCWGREKKERVRFTFGDERNGKGKEGQNEREKLERERVKG